VQTYSLDVKSAASPPAMMYFTLGSRPDATSSLLNAVATTNATRPDVPHPESTTTPLGVSKAAAASTDTAVMVCTGVNGVYEVCMHMSTCARRVRCVCLQKRMCNVRLGQQSSIFDMRAAQIERTSATFAL